MALVSQVYNHLFDLIGAGTIKEGDTFKMILLNASHVFDATDTLLTDVNTNEIANGNGYVTGGVTLSSFVIFNGAPGEPWLIDFADLNPGWTAASGNIGPYAHAVIYDDTVTSPADALMASIEFDDTPNTFTAADGAEIRILVPAGGFISLAAA